MKIPSRTPRAPSPQASRAADYRWIIGQLEKDARADHWFVRYQPAIPGEAEAGRLELLGVRSLGGFQAGEWVRVEGERIVAEGTNGEAAYRPFTIQTVPGGRN